MNTEISTYKVLLNPEPEGGYTVTMPALSGCITYGSTIEEALSMAKEMLSFISKVLLITMSVFLIKQLGRTQ
jgi:predicted RNase H-like HicB family nuclease